MLMKLKLGAGNQGIKFHLHDNAGSQVSVPEVTAKRISMLRRFSIKLYVLGFGEVQ
ncbi:hypothetical protein J1N35_029614 [Gossypium stocksii]|uniref:Uncharacterized protein n=1 Tax=Gossypium stocksii TaxID=47602 RepID=A0A9D3ZTD8_9ROSI|nr:hypothetical protein J1N35_029614 [Gossypium stocksii]